MEPVQQPAPAVTLIESTPDEARRDLLQRLKGSTLSAGFTLLSIIQGVALADLASVVANNYTRFALVQWLLVATTFLLLIAAWNQITMETLLWVHVPNIEGYVLPFLLGGLELFLNHALVVDIQAWLIGMSITAALSAFAMWYTERNAALHEENVVLLAYLQPYRRAGMRYNIVGVTLLLLLALLGGLGWFSWLDAALRQPGAADSSAALLTGCWLLVFLQRHFFYWRIVVAYAQGREPPKKKRHRR